MRKFLKALFALALVGLVFNSCKKDDETASENSITIEGTFSIGDKTFTNPTFDLGSPVNHYGHLVNLGKLNSSHAIQIRDEEPIDIDNNIELQYYLFFYGAQEGSFSGEGKIEIYIDATKQSYVILSANLINVKVIKVEEVGGYIQGTYEGTFYNQNSEDSYPVKGVFKVMHVNGPNIE